MNDLERVHCRLCRQTFLTPAGWETGSQRCDACGKTGGLVKAESIEAEERQQIRQQIEADAKKKKRQPTRRELIRGSFATMIFVGVVQSSLDRRPAGFYGRIVKIGWMTVGTLGLLATWIWPKKQPRDQPASSRESSEDVGERPA